MSTDTTKPCHQNQNWEERQKHASFYQNQIGLFQQAAFSAMAFTAVIITVGIALSKSSDLSSNENFYVISFAAITCIGMCIANVIGFSNSANRIRDEYIQEHDILFPGATPYSLESYLLEFSDNLPAWARRPTKQVTSKKDSGKS